MINLYVDVLGRRHEADLSQPTSLGIPLEFDGPQPSFFGAPPATAMPLRLAGFTGSVRDGASCNCAMLSLTPHCNGTHTETVGHLVRAPSKDLGVHAVLKDSLMLARLVTVSPVTVSPVTAAAGTAAPAEPGDRLVTAELLAASASPTPAPALVVRTLPNPPDKRWHRHDASTPWFTAGAMQWLVDQGVRHLLVDLPSVDRLHDGGQLLAHRIFFGLEPGSTDERLATRPDATITEFIYVPDALADGWYLLDLQVAPFATEAAPSRPMLYPLRALE